VLFLVPVHPKFVILLCIRKLPGVERLFGLFLLPVPKMCYVLYIIQRRSERLALICRLLYINQLPTVWREAYTQNLLYIIQRRSERLALFLLLYIIQLPVVERTQNLLYIIQRLDVLFLLLYINRLPVVERIQNLLYIIQRRSERLALFFCYISINCLLEWSVPKICYISSNADRLNVLFLLLYIIQLPVVERTQNLLYIIQRRSTRRAFSFVIYH
jgi:hypothetical protein